MNGLTSYYKPEVLKWFRIFGLYQIIGGVIGIIGILWFFAQNVELAVGLVGCIGLVINGFSIYAGNQLLKYDNFKPTYIIQTIQILNFIGLGITYQLVMGMALGVEFEWIDSPEIVFNLKLLSLYEFEYDPTQTDAIRVVVNFIPIFIINYLMKQKEQAEERKRLTADS